MDKTCAECQHCATFTDAFECRNAQARDHWGNYRGVKEFLPLDHSVRRSPWPPAVRACGFFKPTKIWIAALELEIAERAKWIAAMNVSKLKSIFGPKPVEKRKRA